jgi:hypothetical protein
MNRTKALPMLKHGLDATNNVSERAIRALIGARKNWGGNRTERGARAQAVLTSILQTAKQQGKSPSMFWCNYCVVVIRTGFSISCRSPRRRRSVPHSIPRLPFIQRWRIIIIRLIQS